jgi:YfiH family protein
MAEDVEESTEADAVFTKRPNTVCGIMTADCLPILVTNKNGDEIAAIHAGWKGLASNIIKKTIKRFESSPESLIVQFGPAISQRQYEVRDDFIDHFLQLDEKYIKYVTEGPDGTYCADLFGIARYQLEKLNVNSIYDLKLCTRTEEDKFFSHRRHNPTGRMAALIWIENR